MICVAFRKKDRITRTIRLEQIHNYSCYDSTTTESVCKAKTNVPATPNEKVSSGKAAKAAHAGETRRFSFFDIFRLNDFFVPKARDKLPWSESSWGHAVRINRL